MEHKDRPSEQGGQEQGNQKPGKRGRQGQGGSDKPTTRPTPSGVPNEGRSTAGSARRQDQEKHERQVPREIPNPEDQNDRGSRSGFDGNAAEQVPTNDDEGDEGFGVDQNQGAATTGGRPIPR